MAIDSRYIFLNGKHVYLKVLAAKDVQESNWFGSYNDEETNPYYMHHYFPNTPEQQ